MRRTLIGANIVVAVALVASSSALGYVHCCFGQDKKITPPHAVEIVDRSGQGSGPRIAFALGVAGSNAPAPLDHGRHRQ